VLQSKDLCIGCGYCFYACPFGAPQYPQVGNFGSRGKMDKCTFCAGGPEDDPIVEKEKYGANRIAEGKLPLCAEMCSTKALLAGDAQVVSDIFRERVVYRGHKDGAWSSLEDGPAVAPGEMSQEEMAARAEAFATDASSIAKA